MNGVYLQTAPKNWQILQQIDGKATVALVGQWHYGVTVRMGANLWRNCLYRVMNEADNSQLIPWTACTHTVNADCISGEYEAKFALPCGGLYRIETALDTKNERENMLMRGDMIQHLAVGDVFIIAGQSNAVGFGKDSAPDAMHEMVHVMHPNGAWDIASHPIADYTTAPELPSADLSVAGTSPFLTFGKVYYSKTRRPVGLVPTALGGSPICRWNKLAQGDLMQNMEYLFGVCGGKCAGILWYQGCSDTNEQAAVCYEQSFSDVLKQLREAAGDDTPVFTMQLNCVEKGENVCHPQDDCHWGMVREAQRQAAVTQKGVYIVPTFGASLSDTIHNSSSGNILIGQRLANVCAAVLNGEVPQLAPDVQQITACENEISVIFKNVRLTLEAFGEGALNDTFDAIDSCGTLIFEKLEINGNKVILTTTRKTSGDVYISYAYRSMPRAVMLRDVGTYFPALAFYRVKAKTGL